MNSFSVAPDTDPSNFLQPSGAHLQHLAAPKYLGERCGSFQAPHHHCPSHSPSNSYVALDVAKHALLPVMFQSFGYFLLIFQIQAFNSSCHSYGGSARALLNTSAVGHVPESLRSARVFSLTKSKHRLLSLMTFFDSPSPSPRNRYRLCHHPKP